MRNKKLCFIILVASAFQLMGATEKGVTFFDYPKFQELVQETQGQRAKTRLSEKEFLEAINSGDYILLDARSHLNYLLRHIKGAVNLPLTEFTSEKLSKVIPNKKSKILIYCNNNFTGSPISMAYKVAPASLNITSQVHLRAYGYENIFELQPTIDVKKTILPFVGTEVGK